MDEDKKEEEKKAHVDRSKLEADIKAQTDLASTVSAFWSCFRPITSNQTPFVVHCLKCLIVSGQIQ